jgi:hypothetical protein
MYVRGAYAHNSHGALRHTLSLQRWGGLGRGGEVQIRSGRDLDELCRRRYLRRGPGHPGMVTPVLSHPSVTRPDSVTVQVDRGLISFTVSAACARHECVAKLLWLESCCVVVLVEMPILG